MKLDVASIDLFAGIVIVCIDMFCPGIVDVVFRKRDEGLFVSEHGNGGKIVPKVPPEPDKPYTFH